MKLSDCCGAPFYEPGFPDNDICSSCSEHAGLIGKYLLEEYACLECENLYDETDGDTDERMCSKCGNQIYDENHHSSIYHGADDRYIHKSVGTIGAKHYPDWDMKNKKYITYRKGIIND